jgi:hypothetical protein
MKILINYAHGGFVESQKMCSQSAMEVGGFDKVIEYRKKDIDPYFLRKNENIFAQKRGAGYWLWKPYFILKTLKEMSDEDILVYCDSGLKFVDSWDYFFDICNNIKHNLVLFMLGFENKQWTKRDCFYYMGCDSDKYAKGMHTAATYQICKKNNFTLNFYSEYLDYAQDERIMTDKPNECGNTNHPEFNDHRHDQSILSLLRLRHKIVAQEHDPTQFGNKNRSEGDRQQSIDLHRKRT